MNRSNVTRTCSCANPFSQSNIFLFTTLKRPWSLYVPTLDTKKQTQFCFIVASLGPSKTKYNLLMSGPRFVWVISSSGSQEQNKWENTLGRSLLHQPNHSTVKFVQAPPIQFRRALVLAVYSFAWTLVSLHRCRGPLLQWSDTMLPSKTSSSMYPAFRRYQTERKPFCFNLKSIVLWLFLIIRCYLYDAINLAHGHFWNFWKVISRFWNFLKVYGHFWIFLKVFRQFWNYIK